MNFNKELLFVAGFIIAVVILIQYLSFTLIKKQIKIEVAKRFSYEKSEKTSDVVKDKINTTDKTDNNKENKDRENKTDDESYDIDTPEELKSEGDSYVNPLRSEKNITDDEDN
jgi:amino acid permease